MRKATLICDMQFGSTGKGLIAGYLAERDKPDVVMTNWAANAGHTYVDGGGRKYVHTMVANGVVSPNLEYLMIGPGSCLDLNNLQNELRSVQDVISGTFKGVLIHENAAVITDRHRTVESGSLFKIGSTMKGVGAATIHKIARDPENLNIMREYSDKAILMSDSMGIPISVVGQEAWSNAWGQARRIHIEGAQGFSLGINSGFYPYTTSRECTPAQMLSDLCLPLGIVDKVVGCCRTYPIRVANRYNHRGDQIGTSGPCYPDQREISWEDIGLEPELTTVTKLPRRIFTWSDQQFKRAVEVVRPDEVFLNFCNYLNIGHEKELVRQMNKTLSLYKSGQVKYLGYGASVKNVVEV